MIPGNISHLRHVLHASSRIWEEAQNRDQHIISLNMNQALYFMVVESK